MKTLIQTLAFITALAATSVAVRRVFLNDQPPAQLQFGWVDRYGTRSNVGQSWKVI